MRKVVLSRTDFAMFDTELTFSEFEFLYKHWRAFKRMWTEQGQKFWINFLVTFRMFCNDYGLIKNSPAYEEKYTCLVDEMFIFLHEEFIDGQYKKAKGLMEEIILLAQNKGAIHFLGSKSFTKDPFYNKDSRDCFRHLFGIPSDKMSYLKVCIFLDMLVKFGGSVVTCLRRWLDAEEVASEAAYWSAVASESSTTHTSASPPPVEKICQDCKHIIGQEPKSRFPRIDFVTFLREKKFGYACGPWFIPGWPTHEDPRFHDHKNPLYNLNEDPDEDWRTYLDLSRFIIFVEYTRQYYPTTLEYTDSPRFLSVATAGVPGCRFKGNGNELMAIVKELASVFSEENDTLELQTLMEIEAIVTPIEKVQMTLDEVDWLPDMKKSNGMLTETDMVAIRNALLDLARVMPRQELLKQLRMQKALAKKTSRLEESHAVILEKERKEKAKTEAEEKAKKEAEEKAKKEAEEKAKKQAAENAKRDSIAKLISKTVNTSESSKTNKTSSCKPKDSSVSVIQETTPPVHPKAKTDPQKEAANRKLYHELCSHFLQQVQDSGKLDETAIFHFDGKGSCKPGPPPDIKIPPPSKPICQNPVCDASMHASQMVEPQVKVKFDTSCWKGPKPITDKKLNKLFEKAENGDVMARIKLDRVILGGEKISDDDDDDDDEEEETDPNAPPAITLHVKAGTYEQFLEATGQDPSTPLPVLPGAYKQKELPVLHGDLLVAKPRDLELKYCAKCQKQETIPRSFKKCQQCKQLKVAQAKYYCSRECQVEDWKLGHKSDHSPKKKTG